MPLQEVRVHLCEFIEHSVKIFYGAVGQVLESAVYFLEARVDGFYLLLVLVHVKERNAADWYLKKLVHVIISHLAHQLVFERLEAVFYGLDYGFGSLHLLYLLVDALLNKDALKRAGVQFFAQLASFKLQLFLDDAGKFLCVVLDNLCRCH